MTYNSQDDVQVIWYELISQLTVIHRYKSARELHVEGILVLLGAVGGLMTTTLT